MCRRMNDVEKMAYDLFGESSLPKNAVEEMILRTTDGTHSPDCHCSICEYEEGFEIEKGVEW